MSPTDNCQKYIPCDTSTANCCGCKVSMSLHIILLSKISLWCWLSVCNVFSGLQKSLQLRIWAHLAFLSWSFFICRCSATTCLRRIGVAQWILLFQVAPSRFNAASSSHHIDIMRIASKITSGATNSQKAVRVERIVRSARVEIKESPSGTRFPRPATR